MRRCWLIWPVEPAAEPRQAAFKLQLHLNLARRFTSGTVATSLLHRGAGCARCGRVLVWQLAAGRGDGHLRCACAEPASQPLVPLAGDMKLDVPVIDGRRTGVVALLVAPAMDATIVSALTLHPAPGRRRARSRGHRRCPAKRRCVYPSSVLPRCPRAGAHWHCSIARAV